MQSLSSSLVDCGIALHEMTKFTLCQFPEERCQSVMVGIYFFKKYGPSNFPHMCLLNWSTFRLFTGPAWGFSEHQYLLAV